MPHELLTLFARHMSTGGELWPPVTPHRCASLRKVATVTGGLVTVRRASVSDAGCDLVKSKLLEPSDEDEDDGWSMGRPLPPRSKGDGSKYSLLLLPSLLLLLLVV